MALTACGSAGDSEGADATGGDTTSGDDGDGFRDAKVLFINTSSSPTGVRIGIGRVGPEAEAEEDAEALTIDAMTPAWFIVNVFDTCPAHFSAADIGTARTCTYFTIGQTKAAIHLAKGGQAAFVTAADGKSEDAMLVLSGKAPTAGTSAVQYVTAPDEPLPFGVGRPGHQVKIAGGTTWEFDPIPRNGLVSAMDDVLSRPVDAQTKEPASILARPFTSGKSYFVIAVARPEHRPAIFVCENGTTDCAIHR